MKTKQFFLCLLWIPAFVMAVSCSKQDASAPAGSTSADLKFGNAPELIDSRSDYALLNQFPAYPGGDTLLMQYLNATIKFPQEARDNHISGKVYASFIVEKDGILSNIEILKGLAYGCDEVVLDAIKKMPPWSAGAIDGKNVRVKLVIPVEFKSL